jgi:hypothetical protein
MNLIETAFSKLKSHKRAAQATTYDKLGTISHADAAALDH